MGALDALAEDLGSMAITNMATYNCLELKFHAIWFLQALYTCGAHTHIQATHPYIV